MYSDIKYQVCLSREAKLKIETISGNTDIEGATEAVTTKTISGYVDMNWPNAKGATLTMKTITGEVYPDLNSDFKGKKEKHPIKSRTSRCRQCPPHGHVEGIVLLCYPILLLFG